MCHMGCSGLSPIMMTPIWSISGSSRCVLKWYCSKLQFNRVLMICTKPLLFTRPRTSHFQVIEMLS